MRYSEAVGPAGLLRETAQLSEHGRATDDRHELAPSHAPSGLRSCDQTINLRRGTEAVAASQWADFGEGSCGSKPATSVGFFEASGASGDYQFPDTAPAAERMIGLWMKQSLPPNRNLRCCARRSPV